MKKILLLILSLTFTLIACGQQNGAVETESIKEPPSLIVSSNDDEVVAVLGTYSWSYDNGDGTSTATESDSEIPPRIVKNQTSSLNTKLDLDINLDFTKSPNEISVIIWNNNQKEREVEVEGSTIKADEKGNIVYEIYATWEQGSAHYAVELNVEESKDGGEVGTDFELFRNYLVIDGGPISTAGLSWDQPHGYPYYRVFVENTRNEPLTVTISGNGTNTFTVPANSSAQRSYRNAAPGPRQINFKTSSGAVSGSLSVKVGQSSLK